MSSLPNKEQLQVYSVDLLSQLPRGVVEFLASAIALGDEKVTQKLLALFQQKQIQRAVDIAREMGWQPETSTRVSLEAIKNIGISLLTNPTLCYLIFSRGISDVGLVDFKEWGFKLSTSGTNGSINELRTALLLDPKLIAHDRALVYLVDTFISQGLLQPDKRQELIEWLDSDEFKNSNTNPSFALTDHLKLVVIWRAKTEKYQITYQVMDNDGSYKQRKQDEERWRKGEKQKETLKLLLSDPEKIYSLLKAALYPVDSIRERKSSIKHVLTPGVPIHELFGLAEMEELVLTYGDLKEIVKNLPSNPYRKVGIDLQESQSATVKEPRFKIVVGVAQDFDLQTADMNVVQSLDQELRMDMALYPQSYNDRQLTGLFFVPFEDCRAATESKVDRELDEFVEDTLAAMISSPNSSKKPVTLESFIYELMKKNTAVHLVRHGAAGIGEKAYEVFHRLLPAQFVNDVSSKLAQQKAERLLEIGKEGWHWPYIVTYKKYNRSERVEVWAYIIGSGAAAEIQYAFSKCL